MSVERMGGIQKAVRGEAGTWGDVSNSECPPWTSERFLRVEPHRRGQLPALGVVKLGSCSAESRADWATRVW